jgi:hypothetical protein
MSWRTTGSISISPSLFDSIYHGYPVSRGKWPFIACDNPQSHSESILTCYPPRGGAIIYTFTPCLQPIKILPHPFGPCQPTMFQIKTSQTLLCPMLPFSITTVLSLDVLWQLMASAGTVTSVVINDTLDAHIFTKYLRTSTQFLRCSLVTVVSCELWF